MEARAEEKYIKSELREVDRLTLKKRNGFILKL